MKVYYGIDYSMNSPGITAINDSGVFFHFYVPQKKTQETSAAPFLQPIGYTRKHLDSHDKYHANWKFTMEAISFTRDEWKPNEEFFGIEGYSYGSRGSALFNIAENCGILKYNLKNSQNVSPVEFAPSAIKKYATGKGTAKKDAMYSAYTQRNKIELDNLLDAKLDGNPVSDIIDSYFIALLVKDANQ